VNDAQRDGVTGEEELIRLEHVGWDALCRSGDAAADFYARVLADRILVLLPGGLMIEDRNQMIEAMSGPPWDEYALSEERLLRLDERCTMVAYRAVAMRAGKPYEALITSTYVRDGGAWRLAAHQQTPAPTT
jgi:hypothetical protein